MNGSSVFLVYMLVLDMSFSIQTEQNGICSDCVVAPEHWIPSPLLCYLLRVYSAWVDLSNEQVNSKLIIPISNISSFFNIANNQTN